jgi:hypothetical protein
MYLIQLLLPVYDNHKQPFDRAHFRAVRQELTDRFGGVTAFLRSPALGLWKDDDDKVSRDDVVMFEVMTEELDESWWADYRQTLEQKFKQEELVVRALSVVKL